MNSLTRRSFFRLSLTVPAAAAVLGSLASCGGSKPAVAQGGCADPGAMSSSETSLRKANHYVEQAADAAKTCAGCTFFTPATDGSGCGSCQIYTGGPANAKGHCDSWAAKSAG